MLCLQTRNAEIAALANIAYDKDNDELIKSNMMRIPMDSLWSLIPTDKLIDFVTKAIRKIFPPIQKIILIILERAFKLSLKTVNKMITAVEAAITGFISGVMNKGLMKVSYN